MTDEKKHTAATITCPQCGMTFTCDPDGDCWCKAYPVVKIPDALKSDRCLCACTLDKLLREQTPEAGKK